MRDPMRGYDAWVTREPPEPPEPPTCSECEEDLPEQAYKKVEERVFERCDGQPAASEYRYDDGSHEGLLEIIGEEYRDKTYTVHYSPVCGHKTAEEWGGYQEEISEGEAESYKHEAHWFTPPMACSTTYHYRCPNGHENQDVQV
jgi:hypothetical protein